MKNPRELAIEPRSTINALHAIGVDPNVIMAGTLDAEGYTAAVSDTEAQRFAWPSPEAGQRVLNAWERDVRRAAASAEADAEAAVDDAVNHPAHYTSDPSGVECITITRHRSFNIGNAMKYLWRAGLKGDAAQEPLEKQLEDLDKAVFYIRDERERLLALGGANG